MSLNWPLASCYKTALMQDDVILKIFSVTSSKRTVLIVLLVVGHTLRIFAASFD